MKNTNDTPQFVSNSSLKIFSGTLLSRVSGMLRDVVMAFCFGTSSSLAAFLVAYRFVYLIRRLFGEALLHQGFIPHFEGVRGVDPKKGALFFRDLFASMAIVVGGIILIGEVVFAWISGQTAQLSMLLLPGVFFICLFGLTSGLLQSEKNFFLPSVSPALFNVIWIGGILALRHLPIEGAVKGLSIILSFAFLAQWGVTVPKTWHYLKQHLSTKECFTPHPFSKELKRLVHPLLLGILGVASVQINSAIDSIFAKCASPEGPAYLWYAIRLQQLPLALFGLALSSALLPSLSRAYRESDHTRYLDLIRFGESRTFTLIFPCVIGIFVLGASSVNLLFGRGDFGYTSTLQTTLCLWGYGLALLPYALVQILAPAFYAKKDYTSPAIAFVSSTVLNIALNSILVFVFHFGAASIALATTCSALYNLVFLYRRLGIAPALSTPVRKIALATLLSGLLAFFFDRALFGPIFDFPRGFSVQLIEFGAPTLVFFGCFFAICKWLKMDLYSSLK